MNFNLLLDSIKNTHLQLQDSAAKAVNKLLTVRNWLIGYYIVEYEQKGEDRAQYGERLLDSIVKELPDLKLSTTSLRLCRQFYQLFIPENQQIGILQTPPAESLPSDLQVSPDKLISRLSFSHITLMLTVNDPLICIPVHGRTAVQGTA